MKSNLCSSSAAFAVLVLCFSPQVHGQSTGSQIPPNAEGSAGKSLTADTSALAASQVKADGTGAATLSYYKLMNMPYKARYEFLENYPSEDRGKFLDSLSGPRRAVVATDPSDCSNTARLMRTTFANNKQEDGIVSSTLQDVGHSVLGSFFGSATSIRTCSRGTPHRGQTKPAGICRSA